MFSCSDDGTVCLYETAQLTRIGVFNIKESCRSIDVTKDSKYLFAAAATIGFNIYDVQTGKKILDIHVPGLNSKQVVLGYGDKQILCLYENEKQSYIRIYDTQKVLSSSNGKDIKEEHEIAAQADMVFTKAIWGPKNETIIIATNIGKLLTYNL